MADYSIEVAIPNVGPQGPQGPAGEFGELEAPEDGIIYGRKDAEWVDMTSPANLQVRRGTAAEVAAITPLEGEPVWATDTKRLYIGDGVSEGGYLVSPNAYVQFDGNDEFVDELLQGSLTFTIPQQSVFNAQWFFYVELDEDSTELQARFGLYNSESNTTYLSLPENVEILGTWHTYSTQGITPTVTPLTSLEMIAAGQSGDRFTCVYHARISNNTANAVPISFYGLSNAAKAGLGGFVKLERIA